jgi:DNA invertase Pin-like site-specific DNA recombinase
VVEDAGYSGSTVNRPGLTDALAALESGQASTLVVAKLDRLSRSLMDFATLMERSRRRGWGLVALDLGVDTSTPSGSLVANVMASFAEYERHLIGQRTKDALAEKRAQGVKLGRPRSVPDSIRGYIGELRAAGMTWQAIADVLNARGVPTGQGGAKWYANTVRRIALSERPAA